MVKKKALSLLENNHQARENSHNISPAVSWSISSIFLSP
jgi:hypothetical protein